MTCEILSIHHQLELPLWLSKSYPIVKFYECLKFPMVLKEPIHHLGLKEQQ
jgi:hypothetical protein